MLVHDEAGRELQHLRQRAALAKRADQLDVRQVVGLAAHLLHVAPELEDLVDEVDGEVVGPRADLRARHRDRAPADQHLVHRVARPLALEAHLLEDAQGLRELILAEVLVDEGGVRGREPEVESLRDAL